ncbi:hypothetical protein ACIQTZ_07660 [Paenarthrobacter sp. NPDC090520]|uniref:hypothetical protein n=1 Tax=Paenarthrobacter sp. NPDC090520 TaxID=3364382 RepID=UPI003819FB9D
MQGSDILVDALGGLVRIRLDFADHEFDEDRFREFTGPWRDAAPSSSEPAGDVVRPVAEMVWRFPDENGLAGSIAELSTYATLAAIEARRGTLLMLHAAGIADESGRVAAFIGPSGRGKTTLARALGAAYGYVTDETVGIEANGTVHPYRKPLSVIRPERDYKEQIAPSVLGLMDLPAGMLNLGALVLVSRVEDLEGPPVISSLGLCHALAAIVPEVSYLADLDRPLQMVAGLVDRCGAFKQVTYKDAAQVLPLVPELLAREEPEFWDVVLPSNALDGVRSPYGDEVFVPALVVDAVETGGQTAILDINRMVHVLDGVGPVVWRSVCDGLDFAGLVREIDELFGAPPEQPLEDAIVGILGELADVGLLVRTSAARS